MNHVSRAAQACAIALFLAGFGTAANASATITTFDPSNSIDTYPKAINDSGSVAGWYKNGSRINGFLRTPDGTITTIKVSGANDTYARSINAGGAIVGSYSSGSSSYGFLRAADGTITTFNIDGGYAVPTGMNDAGTITGSCPGGGFVLKTDGTVHTFNVRGAIRTAPNAINSKGVVAGYYYKNSNMRYHSFFRATDGTITTFDPPGSTTSVATSINREGAIVGYYQDPDKTNHGFVRQPDGSIASVDVPGANFTFAYGIDDKGRITGYSSAQTPGSGPHEYGFVMNAKGKITTFKVLGRRTHTNPVAIANGIITGGYFEGPDYNEVFHGFVRTP